MSVYIRGEELAKHLIPTKVLEMNDCNQKVEWPLLQPDLGDMVQLMANALQCPKDFILSSMFAAVSVAIGNRIQITDGKYKNSPILWLCLVAPSGSNKSEPLKRILRPIHEMDKRLYFTYRQELAQWKENDCAGDPPKVGRVIISDTTPESRNMALADNPQGILWHCDELCTLLGNIGRYSKSGEQSQMLSVWDGDTIKIDRKGDGVLRIDKPFCSIVATTQPAVLSEKMSSTDFTLTGFNVRWLFCYPQELPERHYSNTKFSDTELKPWEDFINGIFDRLADIDPANTIVAALNDGAMDWYRTYWEDLEGKANEARDAGDDYLASIYNKAQIQTLRLALIIHVIRWGGIPDNITVDGVSMAFAKETMEGFIDSAIRVKNDIEAGGRQWTKKDLYRELHTAYPNINQSAFAQSVGVTQQYANKMFRQR